MTTIVIAVFGIPSNRRKRISIYFYFLRCINFSVKHNPEGAAFILILLFLLLLTTQSDDGHG